MAYQMKNISSENRATLAKITSDLEKGILGAIEETKYLQNALGIFKQSINNYADNALEKADIVAKYRRPQGMQSYNLPGIMASSVGRVDTATLTADNQRINELTDKEADMQSQKDLNYSIMISNTNDLIQKINAIKSSAMFLENFIIQMQDATQH